MKIILNTYEEFEVVDTVNDGKEAVEYCKRTTLISPFRCSHAKYERGRGDKIHLRRDENETANFNDVR